MLPKGIKYGNVVRIKLKDHTVEGILLPRSALSEEDHYNLKLESGYNMGVAVDQILSIEKVEDSSLPKTPVAQVSMDKSLPKIGVVSAGGTIVSRLDYATGGVKYLADPRQLFVLSPKAARLAWFDDIKTPVKKDSAEFDSDDWKRIAKDVYDYLLDDSVKGILVLMGTDSLHYTAAAISFMVRNAHKPVVFTYSQRSTDRSSTDAVLNLEAAVRVALSGIPGVLVVGHASSNDTVCHVLRGTTVRKMHASRRDAFRPINDTPVALVENDVVRVLRQLTVPTDRPVLNEQFEKKIAFIQYVPNMDPDILRYYVKQGYTGAVISMLGLGQIAAEDASNNWLPAIKDAINHGMIICAAPQTMYGSLQPHVYATGRLLHKTGVIYLRNMLAETAYVKLGCALGRWASKKQIEQFMLTNIAGELQEMTQFDAFLN